MGLGLGSPARRTTRGWWNPRVRAEVRVRVRAEVRVRVRVRVRAKVRVRFRVRVRVSHLLDEPLGVGGVEGHAVSLVDGAPRRDRARALHELESHQHGHCHERGGVRRLSDVVTHG